MPISKESCSQSYDANHLAFHLPSEFGQQNNRTYGALSYNAYNPILLCAPPFACSETPSRTFARYLRLLLSQFASQHHAPLLTSLISDNGSDNNRLVTVLAYLIHQIQIFSSSPLTSLNHIFVGHVGFSPQQRPVIQLSNWSHRANTSLPHLPNCGWSSSHASLPILSLYSIDQEPPVQVYQHPQTRQPHLLQDCLHPLAQFAHVVQVWAGPTLKQLTLLFRGFARCPFDPLNPLSNTPHLHCANNPMPRRGSIVSPRMDIQATVEDPLPTFHSRSHKYKPWNAINFHRWVPSA